MQINQCMKYRVHNGVYTQREENTTNKHVNTRGVCEAVDVETMISMTNHVLLQE